jgi:hypothetical protein
MLLGLLKRRRFNNPTNPKFEILNPEQDSKLQCSKLRLPRPSQSSGLAMTGEGVEIATPFAELRACNDGGGC